MAIPFPNKWVSRNYQDPFFQYMGAGGKRAVLLWHRRAGKDNSAWNWMITEASRKTGTYYYFFPTYAQGKKVLWDGMDKLGRKYLDYIPFLSDCVTNSVEMKITYPKIENGSDGSIIQIVGTDNYNALMGTNPIGVVFSEYALQNPQAYKFLKPILLENGGWAVFPYTPRGPNHGKKLFDFAQSNPKWFCSKLTIEETSDHAGNPLVTQEQIEEERAEGEDESIIQQEYYCSFAGGQLGSFYAANMRKAQEEDRVGAVPFDPRYLVFIYSDIGRDNTVLGFVQYVNGFRNFINCINEPEKDLNYFAAELNRLQREEGYQYGGFTWPHDMNVKEWGAGEKRIHTARRLGLTPSRVLEKTDLYDGIDACRRMFNTCRFDERKCEDLLSGLWTYRKKYDTENKVFLKEPVHDWASHFADMFRNCAMARKPLEPSVRRGGRYREAPTALHTTNPLMQEEDHNQYVESEVAYH